MDIAPHLGEILSLATAVLWALAIVLFKKSGEHVHPIALNTFKDILAAILYLPTLYLAGMSLNQPFPASDYWLLVASGVIGLAIGDTLLFQSLNMIGASASALVSTLYSPFIIALGFLWLGETLTGLQLVGVAMILAAVFEATYVRERGPVPVERRRRLLGIAVGVAAMAAMAVGVVMVKPVLDRAPLLWAVEIRMIGGAAALVLYLVFHPRRRRIMRTLLVRESRAATLASSVIGGYVAMMCWLGGMKYTDVSIASALNQTSTIFVLLFAALILRERITPARVAAILAAFAGATLVTFG
jgi:drug/metabolite transporter (DMT)-like permease